MLLILGANDESNWRGILEYFSPAVQLGLTATPKRKGNVDTYAYFGEQVYVYSLKEGINDGFLTPFKVKQIATTLDDYVYTSDDTIIEGEIEEGKTYTEGERQLRVFQDNEKTIPTILTTLQKLSTGVDARNIRNIVLMRPIKTMIEFKQIVGRGTRLFDGKDYFTIYDFVKAYEHFNDDEWDGEPIDPETCDRCGNSPCTCEKGTLEACVVCGQRPCVCERVPDPCPECGEDPCVCKKKRVIKIKLSDGKERAIQNMTATTFWSPEGKPISATEFIERLFGDMPELFKDEDQLRQLWSKPDTHKRLLDGLEEKGYGMEQLDEIKRIIDADKSDVFDVLAYIAFALTPITREERVSMSKAQIFSQYDYKEQQFLDFVLSQYIQEGVGELDQAKLPDLLELKYHGVSDAAAESGSVAGIRDVFIGFQRYLYE